MKRTSRVDAHQMARSAVIFSPHYDDETLGAGGTLFLKRKCGAMVYVVFMTDGSRSHALAMDGTTLAAIRKHESLKATAALGIPETNVFFLEFPETRLAQYSTEAVERVSSLLTQLQCDQVFVPSSLEPLIWSADHNVTTRVVLQALSRTGSTPEIFEYLVWFWYQWPWVSFRGADLRRLIQLTLRSRFSWLRLNVAVPIGEALTHKRTALDKYQSQMTRLTTAEPWPVLSDVAGGEFLQQFFQPIELFRRYTYTTTQDGDTP
jgi:LmbE family N-acetylglucosaminyl deacetylase